MSLSAELLRRAAAESAGGEITGVACSPKPPFRRCILVNTAFWGVFLRRSFGAPLDGLASRFRGSESLPGYDWSATILANVDRVNRAEDIPASNPDGAWTLGDLKRGVTGTPERERILAPERT